MCLSVVRVDIDLFAHVFSVQVCACTRARMRECVNVQVRM